MKKLIIILTLFFGGAGFCGGKLHVSFVLDETGSMSDQRDATISCFNEYLDVLRCRDEHINMTLTKFNSARIDIAFKNVNVSYVDNLNRKTYSPDNMTPLYDAIGKTINSIETKDGESVLFVILTDGLENYSTEYTQKTIFNLIKGKEECGWTFVFLGANQDAYVAEQLGIQPGNFHCWELGNVGIGTSSPFRQLISNTCSFLDAGAVQDSTFFKKGKEK